MQLAKKREVMIDPAACEPEPVPEHVRKVEAVMVELHASHRRRVRRVVGRVLLDAAVLLTALVLSAVALNACTLSAVVRPDECRFDAKLEEPECLKALLPRR